MNLPIITYEIAVELEIIGCDITTPNTFWYNEDGKLTLSLYDRCFKAYYQAEVCKWLRDEHDIYIEPSINLEEKYDNVVVVDYNAEVKENYSTYEAAELAGIKKAIEILKERS